MNNQAITNSIYGLSRMTADSKEVEDLINALTKKIRISRDKALTGQGIDFVLQGIKGLTADNLAVRELLSLLTRKIEDSDVLLNNSMCLKITTSLHSINGNHKEVQEFKAALLKKVKISKIVVNDVSMSIF
jgi:hypothetical protein